MSVDQRGWSRARRGASTAMVSGYRRNSTLCRAHRGEKGSKVERPLERKMRVWEDAVREQSRGEVGMKYEILGKPL